MAAPQVESNAQYQVLEDGQPVVVEARPAPQVVVYRTVEKTVVKRPRSCCGAFCCALVVLLVVLLTLFIPRSPSIGFGGFESIGEDPDAPGTYNVLIDLRFHSKQPVQVDWKDLDVTLEWKQFEDDGTIDIIEVGQFKHESKFSTGAYEAKHLHLGLENYNLATFGFFYAQCLDTDDGGVIARFKGHVKEDGTKFDVRTDWTRVYCYV